MRPKGSPEELERLRKKAVAAVLRGDRQVDVARIFGIYPDTLSKWVVKYRKDPDSHFCHAVTWYRLIQLTP